MAEPKFGTFTKRQIMRMRGRLGEKLRQEMGYTQQSAPRPKANPGTVADRAQAGFERRMREAQNATTDEKRAEKREAARKALEKYHAATTSAGVQASKARAKVEAITAVVSPADIEAAGFSMSGGKLVSQTRRVRNRQTGKVETKTVKIREGRDRAALRAEFGDNWKTRAGAKRLRQDADNAEKRHATMKKQYAKMYRRLTGKGGRSHQRPAPGPDAI